MPTTKTDRRWHVQWKDEDEVSGRAIGPIFVYKDNELTDKHPNWGTKAEASVVARILGCEMEEV